MIAARRLIGLLLAFTLVWFATLDHRRLFNPDEGRYAEIPREMVASGDWITPRLNDIKYFYKPPLQYWATALAYSAFGEHHWTARLWPALTGFAGILLTGVAAARLFGPGAGVIAAAVLAGSLFWNLIGHINTLDMGVSAFLAAAVFAVCLAETAPRGSTQSRRWRDGAWVFLALAVLSKGLIGAALPALAVFAYALWQRDPGLILRLRPIRGTLILLAVTAPWFIAVSLANPEFPHFFFIHEHVERFLTRVHGRYEPAWYFMPILAAGLLPWSAALPLVAAAGARRDAAAGFQPGRFLLCWIVVVFAFFSASSSKLSAYILPIWPALAALVGAAFARRLDQRRLGWLAVTVALAGLTGLLLAQRASGLASEEAASRAGYAAYAPYLYGAAALLLAGGVAGWLLERRRNSLAALLVLAASGHLAGQAVLLGHDHVGYLKSGHDLAKAIRDKVAPDAPFYSVETYDQSLQFYLGRTTTMVAYQDELGFGIGREPEKFIADLAGFERRWVSDAAAWALMPVARFDAYRAQGLPMVEMARDPRRVVVRKP